jgi:predicted TIM-barrel fold metal-dependent hydrolase
VVPIQNVELAVDEIDRCARDPRFVQILLLASGDQPLGKRVYWPIYAAAARHGLTVGIHAGSNYHNPPTAVGWPSYHTEDYAAQAQAFQSQLTSLICEGVFSKFGDLKVVLLESGWTWLPAHLWRLTKYWRGLRTEIPWVDRSPTEIVRTNVRLSLQPTDGPPDISSLERIIEHMQSDELLVFSTDYPHWQFDGQAALPDGLSPALVRKITVDNPRAAYARLLEPVS